MLHEGCVIEYVCVSNERVLLKRVKINCNQKFLLIISTHSHFKLVKVVTASASGTLDISQHQTLPSQTLPVFYGPCAWDPGISNTICS